MRKFSSASAVLVAIVIAGVIHIAQDSEASAGDSAAKATSLKDAAQRGEEIFASDSFGSKRMINGQPASCASCHSNNGKTQGALPNGAPLPSLVGAAAQFPKFDSRKQVVITLQEQVMHCISGGLKGTPPAYNSPQIVNLVTYLTWLSKGSVMGKQF